MMTKLTVKPCLDYYIMAGIHFSSLMSKKRRKKKELRILLDDIALRVLFITRNKDLVSYNIGTLLLHEGNILEIKFS